MKKQQKERSRLNLQRRPVARVVGLTVLLLFPILSLATLAQPTEALPPLLSVTTVEKWKRFEAAYQNGTWNGNPFDLEFKGLFRHEASGRVVTQLGFYAGNNTWKLYFMPDEVGEWTYTTQSPDPQLNGRDGSFTVVTSKLPGRLLAHGNRWRLEDTGKFVAPIMLPTNQWFKRTNTNDSVGSFIMWTDETANALIIRTTLLT